MQETTDTTTMPDTALITAMLDGSLRLNFIHARLDQPENANPEVRQGTARVGLSPDGQLKLTVNLGSGFDVIRAFNAQLNTVPGEIIEEGEFYQLEAKTKEGDTWTSRRFFAKRTDLCTLTPPQQRDLWI